MAPFSFVMPCSYNPPIVCFACGQKKYWTLDGYDPARVCEPADAPKDTLVNIRATGEFIVTPVHGELHRAVVVGDKFWPYGVNEMEKAGLTPVPAGKVRVPLIKEAKISLECRLVQILPMGDNDMIFGEVLLAHVAPETLVDGVPHTANIGPVTQGNLGGQFYTVGSPVTIRREPPYRLDG